jgi:hypothetical protein
LFPDARFSQPASAEQIAAVENSLSVVFPDCLRDLYLECDGFRESKGNAKYLLSLKTKDTVGSLVSVTRYWWEEWPKITQPGYPIDFSPFLFFGFSSADEIWAIRWKRPIEVIAYHHSMESEVEYPGDDILALYQRDYAKYVR